MFRLSVMTHITAFDKCQMLMYKGVMNTEIQITNKRNQHGVKNSCDQYRTIKGEHYIQWTSDFDEKMVAEYRVAGVKVRIIGGEMYIRQGDTQKALTL